MGTWSRRSAVVFVLVAAGALALAACAPTKKATPRLATFSCTNGAQTFTVPAGVQQIGVDAYGAQGGAGDSGAGPNAQGGQGGRATAVVAVAPGETLQVNVGCRGADAPGDPGALCMPGAGGFNGGARGGMGDLNSGGGGGGGSDVRRAGNHLVAAGGGGGGGIDDFGDGQGGGGAGGGATGGDGQNGQAAGTLGGGGGSQIDGGGGGFSPIPGPAGDGVFGALGTGGRGGDTNDCTGSNQGGGGGGGGGYYGGGGRGADDNHAGAAGGGGGSGFGPSGAAFQDGVRAGDGLVRIGYST